MFRSAKHVGILLDSLRELARPLITLWVIRRQRDSLELLKDYMDNVAGGIIHVVENGYLARRKNSNSTMTARFARR